MYRVDEPICIVECYSFITGLPQEKLCQAIGVDPYEIVSPHYRKPFCYRSYTVDELTWAIFQEGFKTMQLDYGFLRDKICWRDYGIIAFKGHHCVAQKEGGEVLDLQKKVTKITQFFPCEGIVVF